MKRSYKQNCALALAADMLCERWTLLIFRELLIRACRFKDFNDALPGMGTNLLSTRLKELEQAGLIEKQHCNDKLSAYQLTSKGLTVEPLVLQLISWGHSHLSGHDEFSHQAHWDLLAMKALFNMQQFKTTFKPSQHYTLQFAGTAFVGWVQASHEGISIGLGHSLEQIIIPASYTVDMSVQEFQNCMLENEIQDDDLQKFARCFGTP